MKCKKFEVKGATVLVLQVGDMVWFYMNYKAFDYFYCAGYSAKIEEITESDAIDIWNLYFDCTVESENAMISYFDAKFEEHEKRRKSRRKRKRSKSLAK